MATLSTYDPKRVTVNVGGIPITGFGDGTFITIEEMTAGVSSKAGADGEVARSMSPDPRVEIVITLLATSASNTILSGFYTADRITAGGTTIPVLVEDLSGLTEYASGQCWIRKQAKVTFAKEVEMREWTIECVSPNISAFVSGGNS